MKIIIPCLLILLGATKISAKQWEPCIDTSKEVIVYALESMGEEVFASMNGNGYKGLYVSTDFGITWKLKSNGLTHAIVDKIETRDSIMYALTVEDGLFESKNYGKYWKSKGLIGVSLFTFKINKSNILVGSGDGLYYSKNNGDTWNLKEGKTVYTIIEKNDLIFLNNGTGVSTTPSSNYNIENKSKGLGNIWIYNMFPINDEIILFTNKGIYVSSDDGDNWIQRNSAIIDTNITDIQINNDTIYALTKSRKIFTSIDSCRTWQFMCGAVPDTNAKSILLQDNKIFNYSFRCIYVSLDRGEKWQSLNWISSVTSLDELFVCGSGIYVGTYSGIFSTSDMGKNWISRNVGLENETIMSIAFKDSLFFAGGSHGRAYMSTDFGENWFCSLYNNIGTDVNMISISGNNIFAAVDGIYHGPQDHFGDMIYFSTNKGKNWDVVQGIYSEWNETSSVTAKENKVIIGKIGGRPFVSNDTGKTFRDVKADSIPFTCFESVINYKNRTYVNGNASIYIANYNWYIWTPKNKGIENKKIRSLYSKDEIIYAGSEKNGVCFSKDDGETWIARDSGMTTQTIISLTSSGDYLFAGTYNGLYRAKISEITDVKDTFISCSNSFSITPNPAEDKISVNLELMENSRYKLAIVNSIGQVVREICGMNTNKGTATENIDVSDLSSGMYYLVLQSGSRRMGKSFVVVR